MKKEDIMSFIGHNVKLSLHTGFVINGKIDRISEETIFFSTQQTKSVIDIKSVSTVVLLN